MESDFYNTATAGIWYTLTYMVAGCVTDPLEDAIYIPNRLATIAPNTNNNLKTDDIKTTTAIHCDTNNYAHNGSPHVVNHKKRHLQGATETYTTRSTRVYSTSLTGTNQTDNISTDNKAIHCDKHDLNGGAARVAYNESTASKTLGTSTTRHARIPRASIMNNANDKQSTTSRHPC